MYILLDGKLNSDFCLAISELRREQGRVSTLNWSINWLHHIKGHAEIGYLTEFGVLKLNRDQVNVMTLETLLKIHTTVCNFCDSAPPPLPGVFIRSFTVPFSSLLLASSFGFVAFLILLLVQPALSTVLLFETDIH